MQWQPEDRRATFTKKKSKLQWTCENQPLSNTLRQYPTDRSQGRNSPFSLLNPVVDPIKSPVLNKTFEVEEKSTKPSGRVASPERIVGQPDSTGSWLVSPPKRLKVKPPSDSPVVLPPPSRVARRSTMTQRFMDRPGSTPVTVQSSTWRTAGSTIRRRNC
ncbi:hypothetical protein LSTR_LSTR011601 [Laodelphax striatellus]|uniref:Uncharacterized protein n=1 Tax=Laodelphax striatellus TaxID=195883 RepID=A0A482X743_LAOST|nr:hypothetical protein LSTR_LSTR011601 [Laodelphax striatellus]